MSLKGISREDLILSKLDWCKQTLSQMQESDVKKLIETATELDLNYLKKWASQLGVLGALDRALK